MNPTVDNVLEVYRRATDDQVRRGLEWYADAHSLAVALDPDNVSRAAGVISALSPRISWARNVTLAVRAYAEGMASGTVSANCKLADRILSGEDPADVLKGRKTAAFWATIADPTNPWSVVIDRHAVSVAIGRVSSDEDTAKLSRKGMYDRFCEVYREAASIVGVSPSQLQAITWVVWRESEIRTAAAVRDGRLG